MLWCGLGESLTAMRRTSVMFAILGCLAWGVGRCVVSRNRGLRRSIGVWRATIWKCVAVSVFGPESDTLLWAIGN